MKYSFAVRNESIFNLHAVSQQFRADSDAPICIFTDQIKIAYVALALVVVFSW